MARTTNTGPETAQGVDGGRHGSTDSTVYNEEGGITTPESQMPKVDMAHAASLRPSRLHGKPLLVMVNVLAGVAFVTFGYDRKYPILREYARHWLIVRGCLVSALDAAFVHPDLPANGGRIQRSTGGCTSKFPRRFL